MKDTRPKNLNIWTMKFPVTAIISILHRLTGVFLFLMIPLLLLALQYSLQSPAGFACVQHCLSHTTFKIVIWLILASLAYHFFAGIRHLIMDVGFGESWLVAKITSWMVLLISILFFIFLGIGLWA